MKRTIFWPSRPHYPSKTPRPNYVSEFSTWRSTTVQAGELTPNGIYFKPDLRQRLPCDPFPHASVCGQPLGSDFSQGWRQRCRIWLDCQTDTSRRLATRPALLEEVSSLVETRKLHPDMPADFRVSITNRIPGTAPFFPEILVDDSRIFRSFGL